MMSFTSVHLTAVGIALLTVIAATILLQERRMPQSTLAWLLAIMVMPYLAAPLFLLLGARKFGRRRPPRAGAGERVPVDAPGTFRALGAAPARGGNLVQLVETPEAAWEALVTLVQGAQTSLDANYYIVSNDPEGRAFLNLLAARAAEGVRVRLILDRIGSFFPPRAELRRLRRAGGELRWMAPLLNRWSRGGLNLRNHRKVLIADGARLMTGGMNVGADYMRSGQGTPRRPPFHDLNLWLEGPAVQDYLRLFHADWAAGGGRLPAWRPRLPAGGARLESGPAEAQSAAPAGAAAVAGGAVSDGPAAEPASPAQARAGAAPVSPAPAGAAPAGHASRSRAAGARAQLVASGPDRPLDALHKGLVQAVHRADRRVWLSTPYFVPTGELLLALATAGRRGLDVRIMVPARSNHPTADLAGGAALRFLQGEGCRILRAPQMVHAKCGAIDAMAWVGTANLDLRSLLLNFETALMLHDPGSVALLEDWFERHFLQASTGVPPVGLLRRLGEGLFRLVAPLL